MAGSIALVGFGFDSLIEVTSGAALLWRLHSDADDSRRQRIEADPVAALIMVPIIVKEGIEGLRGDTSCEEH